MISRAEIKERAKAQLGHNIFSTPWLMALAVMLILGAVVSAASGLSLGIASLIIAGPLAVGTACVFLNLIRAGDIKIETMFTEGFTKNLSRNILLGLLEGIFVFLWSMLFIIPGIVKAYAYSMSEFIAVDHPDWDWRQCINESQRITRGHKGELFILDLSFIGWYIVGSLCFGLGTLWVAPYHMTAKAIYYELLKDDIDYTVNTYPVV